MKAVTGGTTDAKKEYEEAKKRYQLLLKKQETLLRGVCLNTAQGICKQECGSISLSVSVAESC